MVQLLIAGLFAVAFGTIYVYGTIEAIRLAANCAAAVEGCNKEITDIPSLSFILTTVGNLISGSIVGILALSEKNDLPAARLLDGGMEDLPKRIAKYIPLAFIFVWVGCGVATVICGLISYPDEVPPLTAQAKGFLGSAATALLAYLAPLAPTGTEAANGSEGLPEVG